MFRFITLFLVFLILFQLLLAIVGFSYDMLVLDDISMLSIASFFLFIVMTFVSLRNDRIFVLFLPFVIVAFPSPVNDFFIGYPLGPANERGFAIFPFITHIDIYLLVGIIRKCIQEKKIKLFEYTNFYWTIALLAISFVFALIGSRSENEILLLYGGSFQLRYLLEFYLIVSLIDFSQYQKSLLKGLMLIAPFLLLESITNTYLSGNERLVSGSLGMNTFGNLIGALLILFVFLKRSAIKLSNKLNYARIILIFICLLIVILTKNRVSVLAIILSFLFIKAYLFGSTKKFILWGVIGSAIFFVTYSSMVNHLPLRYNLFYIVERIEFNEISINPSELLTIESDWETNSLITRLQLYAASINMIESNLLFGIGTGRWNDLKYEYGFNEMVLLDSHNGVLSILSQYGICGIGLIFFVYLSTINNLKRDRDLKKIPFLVLVGLVNIFFIFADLTNAGIFKHQVFAFLVFTAMLNHFNHNK